VRRRTGSRREGIAGERQNSDARAVAFEAELDTPA
jgi:hypothetical protein